MEQRLSVITIGVDNLPAMRNFYVEKLGWQPIAENKDIVFFQLNGLLFSLFGRKELADFIGISGEGSGFRPYNLAYMVNTKEEVVALFTILQSKGVKIVKAPQAPSFGGYAGYFEDIEGNLWEISYNPLITLDNNGNVITHKNIDHL